MRTQPCSSPAPAGVGLDDHTALTLVHCPHCGDVASIEWRATIDRTVHLKVRCIQRHWFLLPADMVTAYASVDR